MGFVWYFDVADVFWAFDDGDGGGCFSSGADDFLVVCVADEEDVVALAVVTDCF